MMITSLSIFIVMVVYLLPTDSKKTVNTNLEVEYLTGLGTNTVYLVNPDLYLVKTPVLLSGKTKEEQIAEILSVLTLSKNSTTPTGLQATIPEKTKVNEITITEDIVTIDFSSPFLKVADEMEIRMIESIVHSVLNLPGFNGVKITVEGEPLTCLPRSKKPLPETLTKKIGINKEYFFTSPKDVMRVVVYYSAIADDKYYYVPVTKYVNDTKDKVKIIVDSLTSNYIYEPNLMSFLNSNTQLLDYKIENDVMLLNFSDEIFTDDGKVLEEVIYSLSYSIFDNYEVAAVLFEVNGQEIGKTTRAELDTSVKKE